MPSYTIRDVPEGLIARAKARARELQPNVSQGHTLDALLIRTLEAYAAGAAAAPEGPDKRDKSGG